MIRRIVRRTYSQSRLTQVLQVGSKQKNYLLEADRPRAVGLDLEAGVKLHSVGAGWDPIKATRAYSHEVCFVAEELGPTPLPSECLYRGPR